LPEERDFFRESRPAGFILFARNCREPRQLADLVAALRAAIGRPDAPVLIDQEGGRVARLGPPSWWHPPAAGAIAAIGARNLDEAKRASFLHGRLIAADLAPLGITVDCAPVLDLRLPETHQVIGDRAYGADPALVATLGRACCDGLLAGGVLPVIKHMPGHGRARADSHLELPEVSAPLELLRAADFRPFAALADMPWAMTAHIRYSAIDPDAPATCSQHVVGDILRKEIGFDGLLISDDLGMKALEGGFDARAAAALAAGCDLALHCSGVLAESAELMRGVRALDAAAERRLRAGESLRRKSASPKAFDAAAARASLDALLGAS
jgi:beta-N-acetylhexosaminidase